MTRRRFVTAVFLTLVFGLLQTGSGLAQSPASFKRLLGEAGLVLAPPAGLREIAPPDNPLFSFEKAFRDKSDALEVRYAVRPLRRMEIEYNDPHSSAPKPDHMFPLVFQTLIGQLAARGHIPTREYRPKDAAATFNADWAAAALFDADPALNTTFKEGLLVAIHKSQRGDAYTLFLFNDVKAAKAQLNRLMPNLKFADEPSRG